HKERVLYTADREFRSIFHHVLDGILILDNQGICLDANPAALSLLRVPRTGLIGHSLAQFYSEFPHAWRKLLENGCQRGTAQFIRQDSPPLHVSYTAASNYLPGRHVVVLCDTTEKVAAERFLHETEERFRQMADNIQEVFWMMSAHSKQVLYV